MSAWREGMRSEASGEQGARNGFFTETGDRRVSRCSGRSVRPRGR